MDSAQHGSQGLAATITKSASKQTYYTIRLLVDRKLVPDAYRAYAYFRWVDDILDAEGGDPAERAAFLEGQKGLLEALNRDESPGPLGPEEQMLADLVRSDPQENSGLQAYLQNMMEVLSFDVQRRGRLISEVELAEYNRRLATAVAEALYYFIAHDDPLPSLNTRYDAVMAAHITHMLRDACEDTRAGYFNIPGEYLRSHGIGVSEAGSAAYRQWVCGRIGLARRYFRSGRKSLGQLKSLRRRLAAYAYIARFEWLLGMMARDRYCLRSAYPQRKSLRAVLWMAWSTLASLLASTWTRAAPAGPGPQAVGIKDR